MKANIISISRQRIIRARAHDYWAHERGEDYTYCKQQWMINNVLKRILCIINLKVNGNFSHGSTYIRAYKHMKSQLVTCHQWLKPNVHRYISTASKHFLYLLTAADCKQLTRVAVSKIFLPRRLAIIKFTFSKSQKTGIFTQWLKNTYYCTTV